MQKVPTHSLTILYVNSTNMLRGQLFLPKSYLVEIKSNTHIIDYGKSILSFIDSSRVWHDYII